VDSRDNNGATALDIAAAFGTITRNIETARVLIKAGADVNARTVLGDTPLIDAAGTGSVEFIELLVKNHANLDEANSKGTTALMRATSTNKLDVIEELLNLGANPLLEDDLGRTALTIASEKNNSPAYQLLSAHNSPRH